MIATLMALVLHLVTGTDAPVDVFGVTTPLRDVDLLLVAPADRDTLRDKLAFVRKHRLSQAAGAQPRPLVVAIDLSDVPSVLHGRATAKLKERALEVAKHQPKGAPPVSFVADHDGSVGRAFRGPQQGSYLVTLNAEGKNVGGVSVDELIARSSVSTP